MGLFGKKDDVSKQREQNKKKAYRKCGKKRTYKTANKNTITVYCLKNANVRHRCD